MQMLSNANGKQCWAILRNVEIRQVMLGNTNTNLQPITWLIIKWFGLLQMDSAKIKQNRE